MMALTISKKTICLSLIFSSLSTAIADNNIKIGINYHLLKEDTKNIDISIDKASKLGLTLIRLDFPWDMIEKTPGNYKIPQQWDDIINNLISLNISPIIILDYGNHNYHNGGKPTTPDSIIAYANYANFMANHFRGRVKYYEIWNEWDSHLGGKPQSVESYKKLVKPTYTAIKKADSNSQVLTGSFSSSSFNKLLSEGNEDYLKDYLTNDMADYTDIISIHPYTTYRKGKNKNYESYLEQINYGVSLVKNNVAFSKKPIFITEIGWSTANSKDGVEPATQREYIQRAICDANKIGISAIILYDLKDESNAVTNNTAAHFGLFDSNWSAKTKTLSLNNIACN
ncbi:cellulase family glycosylhydrolase [Klebsiella aerogenes]|uniref:cellulase family glycosylhydrolase n=1 Tax=Klebsiella aerogenes TaxID=548 RepID=UPI000F7D9EEC|nr:cellulase family glycosylhydrolase [Klebsiella aerogenes]RSV83352.1 hypothetical protein EGH57_20695 [Klebsiella aerogenes]